MEKRRGIAVSRKNLRITTQPQGVKVFRYMNAALLGAGLCERDAEAWARRAALDAVSAERDGRPDDAAGIPTPLGQLHYIECARQGLPAERGMNYYRKKRVYGGRYA